jgi:hypothetical protein
MNLQKGMAQNHTLSNSSFWGHRRATGQAVRGHIAAWSVVEELPDGNDLRTGRVVVAPQDYCC